MKIRKDFVTNSSSSSFICAICDNVEIGYDVSLSDVGYVECENGHIFCEHHIDEDYIDSKENLSIMLKKTKEEIENCINKSEYYTEEDLRDAKDMIKSFEENENYSEVKYFLNDYEKYVINESKCPVCSLEEINRKEIFDFILKKNNLNEEKIRKDIKESFKNHKDFLKYINEVNK